MADRYWRGGTAAWDGTAGTKWASTVGGAGGASVPTTADDVFFDATSSGTCTISAGNTGAKSINCTGFTGTLSQGANITIAGSLTIVSGMTFTRSGFTITFTGTGTFTTGGKSFNNGFIVINGSGITVTLGDAYSGGTITLQQGTLTTANYNITCPELGVSGAGTKVINAGSSTISVSSSGGAIGFGSTTNTTLTFNAGTSQINLTEATGIATLQGGGQTFYNVAFTGNGTGTKTINAPNTFNNLSITGPSSAGVTLVEFSAPQTINGTFSTTGTAGNRRVWFRGVTYGIAQTLTINATAGLTDADFRDIYVIGTAAPISGTRIGNLGSCRGVTFSTPKTVYWNLAGTQNFDANGWAATAAGSPSTDNYPLAQDTAAFTDSGSAGTITLGSTIRTGTIDFSARTTAMTFTINGGTIYGGWKNGSINVISNSGNALTFAGDATRTITTSGRSWGTTDIIIDCYGGVVELADALSGIRSFTVTNGTFDTKNFNFTNTGNFNSTNSNVREIRFGSSTVTTAGIDFTTSTNLTFNAGTSQIDITNQSITASGIDFYNVTYINTGFAYITAKSFNNLNLGRKLTDLFSDITVNGTLSFPSSTVTLRGWLRSATNGTTRTVTVATLTASDVDFRDITISGAAAGTAPTRAGNMGGNSGITFPSPKTVYWNLAGTQNWTATGWCTGSGGSPDVNNFPLAQDTAVFDDTGSAGTITIIGVSALPTINAASRTSAMTLTHGSFNYGLYGSVTLGSGVTIAGTDTVVIAGRDTTTFTSAGKTITFPITVDNFSGTFQLGDALTINSARTLTLTSGTFDAVSYDVSVGAVDLQGSTFSKTLKMGSGTWTLSGTGTVWNANFTTTATFNFLKGTANIVLSDTSTTARTFAGADYSYNKLTIGGTTGISTLTITGNNQFTELASTKTVAHTIALGTTAQTFGKWTVTGTVGNVVTLTGTGTSHVLAGACTSGIDYLAMGSIGFAATSPGEFYAGVNSTGTAAVPVYRTAKPADGTRYWVGGTGNWSDTARWSTTSGSGSGASVPRSHDDVIFNSGSNATAYTATINAVTGGIRMKSLTIAGPASGNLTLAGSTAIDGVHGNVTLPATGLTRNYTGSIALSSSSTGLTFTTNGVTLASAITVNGVDCSWSLGSALNNGTSPVTITNGSLSLATYNLTAGSITSDNGNSRTINFSTGTTALSGSSPINFGTTETNRTNLTVTGSTSQINCSATSPTFSGNNKTLYNVSFTSTLVGTVTINGVNSFNNLSFTGLLNVGLKQIVLSASQTVTGTLTLSAGTNATMRHFVRSDTIGTTRTITAATVAMTDVDFRDITIAGAAAPASGTRIGDCKGNSGITFTAATTRYWNLAGSNNWSATGWAASSGASPDVNNFPLAQDTCVFEANNPAAGSQITFNQSYNIGTINASSRTTNSLSFALSASTQIYGDLIFASLVQITYLVISPLTFCGRNTQILSATGTIQLASSGNMVINSPGGTVVLNANLNMTTSVAGGVILTAGTFDIGSYTATMQTFTTSGTSVRELKFNNGTLVIGPHGGGTLFNAGTSTNLTITGTGTISMTSAFAKTFAGGDASYTNITLNHAGAGTLTISGNNTFKDIRNQAVDTTTINMGATTQRVSQWTGTGEFGRVLTLQGTDAQTPCTLVMTGAATANVNYLTLTGVRAYSLANTWTCNDSTNNGSLGWTFNTLPVVKDGSFLMLF